MRKDHSRTFRTAAAKLLARGSAWRERERGEGDREGERERERGGGPAITGGTCTARIAAAIAYGLGKEGSGERSVRLVDGGFVHGETW